MLCFIVFILATSKCFSSLNNTEIERLFDSANFDAAIQSVLSKGEIGGYYSGAEAYALLKLYAEKYPKLIQIDKIGASHLGENILSVRLSNIQRSKEATYPGLLMIGMVHARELVSLTTHLYLISKIMYLALHNDPDVMDLLKRTNVYSIPIVNVDGIKEVALQFKEKNTFLEIRKNRHSYKPCDSINIGVDLNRNFGAVSGGPSNECDEEYSGPKPFSEEETKTVQKFVESHQNIKFSFDYHAYGDLYILPSSLSLSTIKGTAFADIQKEAELLPSFKFGTAKELINYSVSGIFVDWMYEERGVPSLSVEIGKAESFRPAINAAISDIASHYKPFFYLWNKVVQQIEINIKDIRKRYCDQSAALIPECASLADGEVIYLVMNVTNKGFSPSDNDGASIDLIAQGEKIKAVKIVKEYIELNTTDYVKMISNGFSISLASLKPRECVELMLVLTKVRDFSNKSYIVNMKYNEYPHLTQRAQKNLDVDTSTVKLDPGFSMEIYAGTKKLRYYIWMALITVGFIGVLALAVFYIAKIWKKREVIPVDVPLPEVVREEVSGLDTPESKDGL